MKILAGDVVVFKTWEELESEFGLNTQGEINCFGIFTKDMESKINKSIEYEVDSVHGVYALEDKEISLVTLAPSVGFSVTSDMVKFVKRAEIREDDILWEEREKGYVERQEYLTLEQRAFNLVSVSRLRGFYKDLSSIPALFSTLYLPEQNFEEFMKSQDKYARYLDGGYKFNLFGISIAESGDTSSYSKNTSSNSRTINVGFVMVDKSSMSEVVELYKTTFGMVENPVETPELKNPEEFKIMSTTSGNYWAVFVSDSKIRAWMLKYLVVAMMPEIAPNVPLDIERAFLSRDYKTYVEIAGSYYKSFLDFESSYKITLEVEKLSKSISEKYLYTANENIKRVEREIEGYERELSKLYTNQQELKLKVLGYNVSKAPEEVNELKEFLLSLGGRMTFLKESRSGLILRIVQQVVFWNEEEYKIVRENNTTFRNLSSKKKELLDNIFLHKKLELYFEDGIDMVISGTPEVRRYSFDRSKYKLGMPNPHHYYYDCWGDNKNPINKALAQQKLVEAVSQTIAAIGGINFADSTVFSKFATSGLSDFSSVKCIKNKETGRFYSIDELTR